MDALRSTQHILIEYYCAMALWTLIALLAVTSRQAETTVVDGVFGCLPLHEALGKMADGTRLLADAELRDQMVFVSARKRPIKEVMARIAEAFHATWYEQSGQGSARYVLRQSPEQKRDDDQARRAARRVAATRFAADLANAESAAGEYYRQVQLDLGNRAAIRLMKSWTEDEWQRLVDQKYVVYCTQPTRNQQKLSTDYLEDAATWVKTYQDEGQASGDPRLVQVVRLKNGCEVRLGSGARIEDLTFRAVKLRFWSSESGTQIQAMLLGEDRSPVLAGIRYSVPPFMPIRPASGRLEPQSAYDMPYSPPEGLVKKAKDKGYGHRTYADWQATHKASEFLDPLDIIVRPVLRDISEKTGLSIVARLPDTMAGMPVPNAKTLGEFLAEYFARSNCRVTDGWLIAPIFDPVTEPIMRSASCPRRDLRSLFAGFRNDGLPPIAAWAETISNLGSFGMFMLGALVDFCFADVQMPGRYIGGIEGIRLFAKLNPDQRALLVSGKPLPCDRLNAQQRDVVARLVSSQDIDYDRTEEAASLQAGVVLVGEFRSGFGELLGRRFDGIDSRSPFRLFPSARELEEAKKRSDTMFYKGPAWRLTLRLEGIRSSRDPVIKTEISSARAIGKER